MNEAVITLSSRIQDLDSILSSRDGNLKSYIRHKGQSKNPSMLDRYGFAWYLGFDAHRRWVPRLNRYGAHTLIIGTDQHDRSLMLNLVASQHYSARPYESLNMVIVVPNAHARNQVRIDHSTNTPGEHGINEVTLVGPQALVDAVSDARALSESVGDGQLLRDSVASTRTLFLLHDVDRFDLSDAQRIKLNSDLYAIARRGLASLPFNIVMSISDSDTIPDIIVAKLSLVALRVRTESESIAILGEPGMESAPAQVGAVEVSNGATPFKIPKSMTSGGFSSVGGNIETTTKKPESRQTAHVK